MDGATIVSGEGVRLALTPAGVGSRVIAAVIDAAIQLTALFVLVLIDGALAGSADDAALAAVLIVEVVLVIAGYPILCEWLTRGRTVGKIALGLRAVRDDGGPITFRHALVRGLAGLVLEKPGLLFPFTTIAGVVTICSSAREKRIGDMMAGTIVLNERSAPQPVAPLPQWVPPPLQPWVLSLDLHRLDDRLALATRQFVTRAHGMTPAAQVALGDDLRHRVEAVTAPPPPTGTPTPALLLSVLAERRRRSAAGTPPAPQQPVHFSPPRPAAPPPPPPPPSGDRGPFAPPS